MYIDKLDNIVNEYDNTYHSAIKMKPDDAKSSTYIEFAVENNDKNPKFKVGKPCKNFKIQKNFCKRLHSKVV